VGLSIETPRIAFRYWLAPAAGLAAALAFAFSAASASGATALEPRLVVSGFTDGAGFRIPRGIAIDPRDGSIYIANTGDRRIEVFSRTGRPVVRFVHRVVTGAGSTIDGEPRALAVDGRGNLLVVDNGAAYVDVLDRKNCSVARLDVPGGRALSVTVARDGTIRVGTAGDSSRIHVYRADYSPAGAWGIPGSEPGRLWDVTALAELPTGNLAVACGRTQLAVQIFTPDGGFIRGFGTHENGAGNFSLPSGIVASADGRIWISDEPQRLIHVYHEDGTYIGAATGSGGAPAQLFHPSALASDGGGSIAVAERDGRFQILHIPNSEEVAAGGDK
jgi:streptogramin lyase